MLISKIISGGQTGADRAALDVAIALLGFYFVSFFAFGHFVRRKVARLDR
jgi:hypothetical protein